jgi:hypothetical protein
MRSRKTVLALAALAGVLGLFDGRAAQADTKKKTNADLTSILTLPDSALTTPVSASSFTGTFHASATPGTYHLTKAELKFLKIEYKYEKRLFVTQAEYLTQALAFGYITLTQYNVGIYNAATLYVNTTTALANQLAGTAPFSPIR